MFIPPGARGNTDIRPQIVVRLGKERRRVVAVTESREGLGLVIVSLVGQATDPGCGSRLTGQGGFDQHRFVLIFLEQPAKAVVVGLARSGSAQLSDSPGRNGAFEHEASIKALRILVLLEWLRI